MPIRVLLADDHQIVRQGLRALMETDETLKVVGEAADGRQAIEMTRKLSPDVLVLDIVMPRLNGLEALRQIKQVCPSTKVLLLSSYNDEHFLRQSVAGQASGYLLKESAAADLLQAIRQVFRGEPAFSPSLTSRLRHLYQEAVGKGTPAGKETRLTNREAETLQLIAEGYANKQIAAELGISIKTVEKHRQQIMHKLNIHEVAGLTRYALEQHMIPSSSITNGSSLEKAQPQQPTTPGPERGNLKNSSPIRL
jgi:DNA-binding NarL/FixJ family response regulator